MSLIHFNKKSIKNAIVEILQEEWPLSARQIYKKIKKEFKLEITYQGIHKAISELVGEKVISKNRFVYLINPDWVKHASVEIARLEEAYSRKRLLKLDKKTQMLCFDTILEAMDFFFSTINTNFYGESNVLILLANRTYFLPLSEIHKNEIRSFLKEKKAYLLCRSNTLLDKMVKNYLNTFGIETHIGVNIRFPVSLFVYGDCIVYIHSIFTKKDMSAFGSLFNSNRKEMKENTLSLFEKLINKKVKTKIVIVRDTEICEIIRIVIEEIAKENNIVI